MDMRSENESVEKMLERYHRGLLTKRELDDFMEMERHRAELREKALQSGRAPGRIIQEQSDE